MYLEELKFKLDTNGLGKYFERLKPFVRNAIRLYPWKVDEDDIAVGQTKIGGRPDLPPGISWVLETASVEIVEKKLLFFRSKKQETVVKPLSFIAQVNLSETAPFDDARLLPETGMLYFFYSASQEAWGFDYSEKNKFKIIYWNGDIGALKRIDFPGDLPEEGRYLATVVRINSENSLPSYGHEIYNDVEEGDDDKLLNNILSEMNSNKMLGYSDSIQDDMELDCELVTNGLFCGDASGYEDPRAKELEPNAKNWRLLLQVDSNDENNMMWGDCGRVYFWIKEDLLKRDFDKGWCCLQCS